METQCVSRVSVDVVEKLAQEVTSSSTRVFVLPERILDKESLFVAIRETVPLDPPMMGNRYKWDALEDSLFSGLQSVAEPEVRIIWPNASRLLRASPGDFEMFVALLEDLARQLADPDVTKGPVKNVTIILGGTWE